MKGPTPPADDPRIRAALEAAYALFATPRPRVIEGCPCCIGTRKVDKLLATPLRELTGQDLWRYVTGVFLTVGSERDFRYLLPRILELAITDPGESPDTEIVLGKLRLASWRDWRRLEREAIEALIDAWFDNALAQDLAWYDEDGMTRGWDTEAVLCGAARAGLDLSPWLVRLARPEAEPVRAFLTERYAKPLVRGAVPNTSFWEDAQDGWRALAAVLMA